MLRILGNHSQNGMNSLYMNCPRSVLERSDAEAQTAQQQPWPSLAGTASVQRATEASKIGALIPASLDAA